MRKLAWQQYRLRQRLRRMICSRLYRDRNHDPDKALLIAGTGRSGTSWVADTVARLAQGRVLFEPFNTYLIPQINHLPYIMYLRPEEENDALEAYCQSLLSGRFRNRWLDREVEILRPERRVIKAIRANLFLKWFQRRFPNTPIVLLLRHPCAVVYSRMKLGWSPEMDIAPLLSQPDLLADFLNPKRSLLEQATSVAEKHAFNWCLHHLVPFQQFEPGELKLIYYEHLCLQPAVAWPILLRALGLTLDGDILAVSRKPSLTSSASSAIVRGKDTLDAWQQALSPGEIDRILNMVRAFGLDYLYDRGALPQAD